MLDLGAAQLLLPVRISEGGHAIQSLLQGAVGAHDACRPARRRAAVRRAALRTSWQAPTQLNLEQLQHSLYFAVQLVLIRFCGG